MSNAFGALLRQFRTSANMTQEMLAERSELSVNAISALERGERQHPYPRTIRALATALDLGDQGLADLVQAAAGNAQSEGAPALERRFASIPPLPSVTFGRDAQVAEVADLLATPHIRLVTLTGAGGVGKTRLAQMVAMAFADRMTDGALFVQLAAITDHTLVASAIVQAVAPDADGNATPESLLQGRHAIGVLDNFEQVTGAANVVARLLRHCPGLLLIVTSRRPLHLEGEHEYPVPPLDVPASGRNGSLAELARVPSVAVFLQRARAVRPDFAVSASNAAEIAELCRHLEGLPLALELAAARVKVLSPRAILANYSRRLELLTGGGPDRPTRLQTMRGAIDWSFALLSHSEQAVFRRLAVFAGSASLDAIPAVTGYDLPPNPPMLDILGSLIDHSLVIREERANGDISFRMLEVIREFAAEQLDAAGESAATHRLHAEWFLDYARAAREDFEGPNRREAHDRIRYQVDNLRAALAWSQQHDAVIAYRLACEVARFWINAGYLDEGWTWMERTLALGDPGDPALQFDACYWGSITCLLRNEPDHARHLIGLGLSLARATGNTLDTGRALAHLADIIGPIDPEAARSALHESLAIFGDLHDDFREAISLRLLGMLSVQQEDYDAAFAYQMD
ncbi:MAG TPA: helix-turn-helix domain-containing protein, partial [Thermomicrobiales bacterium]|nr:helix-turn-helix domain-containing protein [Thermomicrobiales bacterium]